MKTDKNGKHAASTGNMRINKDAFTPVTQDDFLRVDNLCKALLLSFYEHIQTEGVSPEDATELAKGADYFIRDFVVDFKALNLFDEMPGIVRQFAGNWYIFNNLSRISGNWAGNCRGSGLSTGFSMGNGLFRMDISRKLRRSALISLIMKAASNHSGESRGTVIWPGMLNAQ